MANANPNTSTRFQIGNPGNPNAIGRPRKRPVTEAHDDLLRLQVPQDIALAMRKYGLKPNATWADAISLGLARQAIAGNVAAAKELTDRVEGKATQRIELLSHEDRSVEITVQFEQMVAGTKNVDRVIDVIANEESAEKPVDKDSGKE